MTARRHPTDLPDLRLLESLSAARGDRADTAAAQQLLDRIVRTPRTGAEGAAAVPRSRARRTWALAGAAAAATTAAVLAPTALGGSAYATWTPAPTAVAAAEAEDLEADCLASGRALGQGGDVTATLTERRGDYSFSLVTTDEAVGSCLVLDQEPMDGGDEEERAGGSWGSLDDLPAPAADGTTVQWGATFRSSSGEFTSALGRTGSEVVAVEISSSDHPRVEALVDDGWFTAWWPGGAEDEITVTTTLADGERSTRTLRTGDR